MSIEKINQAKAEIAATSAYKTITAFFDADSFCEIDAFAKSGEGFAEVVAGFGTVEGMPVYAFAQNSDICGGAMSKAQAAKLKKLYGLALKTGAPVVGFYDSVGGRLNQGTELLAGCGDVLNAAASLSGVVPQISVVLGTCLGTNALNAASADIVIMSKDTQLSLSVTGKHSDAAYNAENGIASIVCDDADKAIKAAKELILYLPSNNLTMAPQSFEEAPAEDGCGCVVSRTVDGNSIVKLFNDYGKEANVRFARLGGQVVGIVVTKGKELGCKSSNKVAKFVRFCDAFSLPVVTFVNCPGFESIKSATKASAAYAEATTVKISVVTGKAIGSGYVALAGTGANADVVYALPDAVISPVNVEAAAFIMAPEVMNVAADKQADVAQKFADENLSAYNAAQNGYVDGIVEEAQLRQTLISALDMLSGKRVSTLSKKHSTI